MADETQDPKEQDSLPRSREAVDWWLKKLGYSEPLSREAIEALFMANGGTAVGLHLVERDLRRAHLQGADLQGANLVGADLQGSDLSVAYLQGAGLMGADLQGVVLWHANLQGADLWLANLQGANLREANFQGARLWVANLQGADLSVADLQGANLLRADLQGANLVGADLQGASLREANLRGATLAEVTISPDTNLEGVKWDPKYINVLERRGDYEAASAVYRRLKEWHRARGMLTIAGEFHYREQEASRKAKGQRLRRQFKEGLAAAWRRLKGEDVSAPTKE